MEVTHSKQLRAIFGFVENLSKSASRGWKQISKERSGHSVLINRGLLFQRISTEPHFYYYIYLGITKPIYQIVSEWGKKY
jgi:hypothetical protein